MPHVMSASTRLEVESTGDGYPIVFVHEFASDLREWEAQVRWFSRTHRCITYNARGYPPSDVPDDVEEYGWELAVADLLAVLDGLGIDRAHVVGLSMGGYAVLQFALAHPTRVSAVVSAGAGTGSALEERDAWPAYATAAAEEFRTRGMPSMAAGMGRSPTRIQLQRKNPRAWQEFVDHLAEHSATGMANTMARYQALRPSLYDFRDAFAAMTTPVLLAVGDEDAPCLETNLMLKRTIPTAGLWICPNTGHTINLEEPGPFNVMVEAFLNDVERGMAVVSALPLARFKVLDLTRVRSGPTAVRQLADWGADVVMVEAMDSGVDISGPRHGSDFQNLNRNKRSIRIDLKAAAGREVFYRLARDADVVLENFRPDVKQRLGVDFATLHEINPRLVYGSISGFGEDGPYRYRPGLDQIIQGMGGLMSVTGLPGQGPVRAGIAVADSAAGLYCALGVLTALLEREVTGEGRWVRTSLLQAQIAMLDFQAARWLADGDLAGQEGNNHPTAVPMGLFTAADGHVNVAAAGERMFTAFCRAADAEWLLTDERFATGRARHANRAALDIEIAAVIARRTVAEWIEVLNDVGVPCGPVNAIDAVFADPQVQHLRMARTIHDELRGETTVVGQGFDLRDDELQPIEPRFDQRAPASGEHTDEVLAAAGYTPDEIAQLRADGVVGSTDGQRRNAGPR